MGSILNSIVLSILGFLLPSIVIYLAIAFTMILIGRPAKQSPNSSNLAFGELRIDYSRLPKAATFVARDGTQRAYRRYLSQSEKVTIQLA